MTVNTVTDKNTQEQHEISRFGCTIEDMRKGVMFLDLTKPFDLNRHAMNILSDAQETMSHGNAEQARQFINKSKYFISQAMDVIRTNELTDKPASAVAEAAQSESEEKLPLALFLMNPDGSYFVGQDEGVVVKVFDLDHYMKGRGYFLNYLPYEFKDLADELGIPPHCVNSETDSDEPSEDRPRVLFVLDGNDFNYAQRGVWVAYLGDKEFPFSDDLQGALPIEFAGLAKKLGLPDFVATNENYDFHREREESTQFSM